MLWPYHQNMAHLNARKLCLIKDLHLQSLKWSKARAIHEHTKTGLQYHWHQYSVVSKETTGGNIDTRNVSVGERFSVNVYFGFEAKNHVGYFGHTTRVTWICDVIHHCPDEVWREAVLEQRTYRNISPLSAFLEQISKLVLTFPNSKFIKVHFTGPWFFLRCTNIVQMHSAVLSHFVLCYACSVIKHFRKIRLFWRCQGGILETPVMYVKYPCLFSTLILALRHYKSV